MGKIAFLFPGQGAQHPGMGKSFYENSPAVRTLFDKAESLRPGTLLQMFEGDAETLKDTENTQPLLCLADLAPAISLCESGVVPSALAGFSLGEIPALAFGGAFSMEEGFSLCVFRGKFMAKAARAQHTAMAAVLKLSNAAVEEICRQFSEIYPVNYNCPGQLVVSGSAAEMPDFFEEIKKAGGRIIPLNVAGAFHSPFMDTAAEELKAALENFQIKLPGIPVYSNATAKPYSGDPKKLLYAQVKSPVRFEDTVRNMISQGVDTFVECGPGEVLIKFVKKIDQRVKAFSYGEFSQKDAVLQGVGA